MKVMATPLELSASAPTPAYCCHRGKRLFHAFHESQMSLAVADLERFGKGSWWKRVQACLEVLLISGQHSMVCFSHPHAFSGPDNSSMRILLLPCTQPTHLQTLAFIFSLNVGRPKVLQFKIITIHPFVQCSHNVSLIICDLENTKV